MAIFDIRAVVDPLAKELRDSYGVICAKLDTLINALQFQNELTQTTNRLLAALVEQGEMVQRAAVAASKKVKP